MGILIEPGGGLILIEVAPTRRVSHLSIAPSRHSRRRFPKAWVDSTVGGGEHVALLTGYEDA